MQENLSYVKELFKSIGYKLPEDKDIDIDLMEPKIYFEYEYNYKGNKIIEHIGTSITKSGEIAALDTFSAARLQLLDSGAAMVAL